MIGEPFGYRLEKEGDLVHNICPVLKSAYSQSNESSLEFLKFHNDICYDANNPDFLLLICLRQDKNMQAKTLYSDARDICARLTAEEIEFLRKPAFSIAVPFSFGKVSRAADAWSVPLSIIKGSTRYPEITLDFGSGTRAQEEELVGLLAKLQTLCHDVATNVVLEPGDILLINNRKGVHARTIFAPSFEGSDRWLQRVYVRRSLWELRTAGDELSRIF